MTMTVDELHRSSELEKTKKMLSSLTDWQIHAVQTMIRDFFLTPAKENPFRPLTEEELIERIDEGLAQAKRGEGMDAEEFEAEMRREFGFES